MRGCRWPPSSGHGSPTGLRLRVRLRASSHGQPMAFRRRLPMNFAPVTGRSVATLEGFEGPATGQRNPFAEEWPVASIVGHGGVAGAPRHDRLYGPRKRAPQVSFPALRRPLHGAPLRLPPSCAGEGPKRPRSPREADTDYGVFPCALMEQSGCYRRIDRTSFQHHFSAPHRSIRARLSGDLRPPEPSDDTDGAAAPDAVLPCAIAVGFASCPAQGRTARSQQDLRLLRRSPCGLISTIPFAGIILISLAHGMRRAR